MTSAGVAETVREDLRPVSGYVVLEQDGEFLVDLDARHGLRIGDLLSVVTKGREIVHPVTKKVIGRLDEAKAVLRITQVKSGFSIARPLSKKANIEKGDLVRRFAFLTAVFLAKEERGRELYADLREALPELEWQGLFSPEEKSGGKIQVDMTFSLDHQELQLSDREGQSVRSWAVPIAAELGEEKHVAKVAPPPVSQPVSAPQPPGKDASPVQWQSRGAGFGPFASLGVIRDRVLMSAFTRHRDDLLLATADDEHVRLFSVSEGLRQLAVREMRSIYSPVYIAWWRPEKNGSLYLVVTMGEEISQTFGAGERTELSGAIYEYAENSLREVATGLQYFMGTYDRDGDGVPETLLGQELNYQNKFGRTFVLGMHDGKIRTGDPDFDLPLEFAVPGSIFIDLTGDGKPETAMVQNGILWIYDGKKRVYESSKEMGGSIATLTYYRDPAIRDSLFTVLPLEVPPFPRDIDGDGVPELLVVASDVGTLKVPGIGPGVKKSWVAALKFQGGTFRKGRLPGDLENPIQGIWSDGSQVFLVETRTTSVVSKAGSSSVLVLPLGQSPG